MSNERPDTYKCEHCGGILTSNASGGITATCIRCAKVTARPKGGWPAGASRPVEAQPVDGLSLIAAERQRQVSVEGWSAAHDDQHDSGELIGAAIAYAVQARSLYRPITAVPPEWPWDFEWWKPSPDRIRNLVKAGALIAAEIDRLQRLNGVVPTAPPQSVAAQLSRMAIAESLLDRAATFMEDKPVEGDPHWWREYYMFTGQHMILTDEGWESGDSKQSYIETAASDGILIDELVLDEVNAPGAVPAPPADTPPSAFRCRCNMRIASVGILTADGFLRCANCKRIWNQQGTRLSEDDGNTWQTVVQPPADTPATRYANTCRDCGESLVGGPHVCTNPEAYR